MCTQYILALCITCHADHCLDACLGPPPRGPSLQAGSGVDDARPPLLTEILTRHNSEGGVTPPDAWRTGPVPARTGPARRRLALTQACKSLAPVAWVCVSGLYRSGRRRRRQLQGENFNNELCFVLIAGLVFVCGLSCWCPLSLFFFYLSICMISCWIRAEPWTITFSYFTCFIFIWRILSLSRAFVTSVYLSYHTNLVFVSSKLHSFIYSTWRVSSFPPKYVTLFYSTNFIFTFCVSYFLLIFFNSTHFNFIYPVYYPTFIYFI